MAVGLPRLFPVVILVSVAMALVIAVIVGWSIIFPLYHAATFTAGTAPGLWVIMALGEVFLSLVLVALALFLAAAVRRQRLLRRQDAFIDTVTHELRTPLAGLRLGVETLQARPMPATTQERFLHRMHDDLERLQALIDHLIEANRLAHGERHLYVEPVALGPLLANCRDRITARFDLEPGWCQLPEEAPVLRSDRRALEIIVLNLLDNAAKYSDGNPTVTVVTRREDARLRLEVRDRGIGFPPDQARQLFRRFVRLPDHGEQRAGTGLGLYVLAELCRRLGARAEARSAGPGTGATFTVDLPLAAGDTMEQQP